MASHEQKSESSSSAAAPRLSHAAYAKVMLHACKHPSASVVGLLLGRLDGKTVEVLDVVPLFHTAPLAPMLEAALGLVEKHCEQSEGLSMAGVYFANVLDSDDTVSPVAGRICSRLKAAFSSAVLLQVRREASQKEVRWCSFLFLLDHCCTRTKAGDPTMVLWCSLR